MLQRFVSFVLEQRVFVLILCAALVVLGVRAFLDLPIEAFPDVQDVQVQVVTQYLGQAPEEVERTVTLPIEKEMSGVPRITQLRSVSITGLSVVTLTFSDGTDDHFARQQVLEKLQNVTLPASLQPQLAPLSTAVGEIYRYVINAPAAMPAYEVRAVQDWVVRPELRMVPGVADVVSFGGNIKEYQARVNPYQLKKYGLTLDQVSNALAANNGNAGGGLLRRGDQALVVRGIGLFRSLDDIRSVVLASRNGKPITVADVAEVDIGERPESGRVSFNERDSVVEGIVLMTKGQNPSKVVARVIERVAKLNASGRLPKGSSIEPIYLRTTLVNHTLETVAENLSVGALLVVSILIIFLRNWRASLAVATVIPLSLLVAFIMMDARGVPANLISLGAVDFGVIIDSAVVMVEAYMVRLGVGAADGIAQHHTAAWRMQTLRNTVAGLGRPILFSKAIIILAFLPIFTFQRVEGKIFAPVAFTLSFALLGAILLTLTLVPALLSFTVHRADMAETHLHWMQQLQIRYRALLHRLFNQALTVVGSSLGALVITVAAIPLLGSEFLPKLDEGNIWLTIALPPSTALDRTKEVESMVRGALLAYPEVRKVVSQVGRPDDGTDPKGPNNIEILADLKPRSEWRFATKEALVAHMSRALKAIPGLPTNFSQVIQDNVEESLSGVKGEIAVKVFGPDLDILEDKAEQIAAILNAVRGSIDVSAIQVRGQTELTITPNRRELARYGINVQDVNNLIQTALGGSAVGTFYDGDRRFDVTVRLAQSFRQAVDDVGNLQLALPGGSGTVPLDSVATIEVREGASRISREAGGRNVSVKANLLGRDQGGFVAEAQARVAQLVHLPPGYTLTWGGQFENQQRAMQRLAVIVPISMFAIFALLFWVFRSVREAAQVLLIVPFALIGGVVGLALAGLHLSISAAVGFIAVAGISVQNGVIMVEQVLELLRNGHPLLHSVVEGATTRLRPILMTALMAGLGLLPAALSHGIGSETQRPFAVVIVGGVVSATFFTLTLLPVMVMRLSRVHSASPEGKST